MPAVSADDLEQAAESDRALWRIDERVRPFTRDELLKPLEKWFFGRS